MSRQDPHASIKELYVLMSRCINGVICFQLVLYKPYCSADITHLPHVLFLFSLTLDTQTRGLQHKPQPVSPSEAGTALRRGGGSLQPQPVML